MPWRTITHENDRPILEYELEKVVKGFFNPELVLDYIRHFVLFEQEGDTLIKKIAGYHQFHAVREAVRVTVIASQPPGKNSINERAPWGREVLPGSRKAGVVWHTQGSGKSISMCCYAGKLLQQPEMNNPTIVVVTDRNDLDGQLFNTFKNARELLRQTPGAGGKPGRTAGDVDIPAGRRHHIYHGTKVFPVKWRRKSPGIKGSEKSEYTRLACLLIRILCCIKGHIS